MLTTKSFWWKIIRQVLKSALVIVCATVIVWFTRGKIIEISADIEKQHRAAFVLARRSEVLTQLQNDFDKVKDYDARVPLAWPPVDNILDFVAALDSLSVRNAITQSVNFSTPLDEHSIDYGIRLRGNIFTLSNYLRDFESLPYFALVRSLDLRADEKNWEGESSINMSGKIFTRPPTY